MGATDSVMSVDIVGIDTHNVLVKLRIFLCFFLCDKGAIATAQKEAKKNMST